jgi:hypothetical protein
MNAGISMHANLMTKKNFRLKTNNKSTAGEAQPANYLKSRTDYTTAQCQLVNAKQENDELNPA